MTTPNKTPLKPISANGVRHSSSKPAATPVSGPRPSLAPLTPSSAVEHAASLHETLTVLSELRHEFKNSADEMALIGKILSKKKEIADLSRARQEAMRDLVADLANHVSSMQAATANPASIGLQQQAAVLGEQKSAVTAQINALLAEVERLEAEGASLEKQKAALLAQKAEAEAAKSRQMPAMAGTIGLYRNFSSIAWDYDADEARVVKGTFHLDKQQQVKPFEFDQQQMSDFDIANKLWEMMEAAY